MASTWAVIGLAAAPAHAVCARAYVTNALSDNVSVIDTATDAVVATVGVGDHPFDVAVAPHGSEVYVSNRDSGTVSAIDAATNTVMTVIPVGDQPLSLAISPDGTLVYVSRHDDDIVSVIDTATLAVTSFPTADPLAWPSPLTAPGRTW